MRRASAFPDALSTGAATDGRSHPAISPLGGKRTLVWYRLGMLHKRDLSGTVEVDEREFQWELRREPQWCTVDGWKGMLVGVRSRGAEGREALLQFRPPTKAAHRARAYRHRPQVQRSDVEKGIRSALSAGWEPEGRGKPFQLEL